MESVLAGSSEEESVGDERLGVAVESRAYEGSGSSWGKRGKSVRDQ